jgi:dihydroorotate dehydrogenase electron transfer subunit
MVQTEAQVTHVQQSGPFVRVSFTAPALRSGLAPGRFVLADLGHYLRTPLFPASLDAPWLEAGGFDVLVPPDHPAAALLLGARVDLIGPLGQGFEVPTAARRLLLVASLPHLAALLPLAGRPGASRPSPQAEPSGLSLRTEPSAKDSNRSHGEARRGPEHERNPSSDSGPSLALLFSAPTAAELYPIRLLPPALELHVVTADGSAGHRGSALDLFPSLVHWADCVCIADDPAIYPALADIVRETRVGPGRRFAQALVAPPMACGVGACQGCAVPVARGTKLACTDGPVFDLLELR